MQRLSIPLSCVALKKNKEAACLSPIGFLCRNCTQTHAVRLQYHYIHGAWMRQTNSLDDVRRDSGCGCPWRWMEGVRRAGFGKKEGVPSCGWHPSRTPAKSLEKPRNIGLFVDLRYRIWYNMDCENLMPSSFQLKAGYGKRRSPDLPRVAEGGGYHSRGLNLGRWYIYFKKFSGSFRFSGFSFRFSICFGMKRSKPSAATRRLTV